MNKYKQCEEKKVVWDGQGTLTINKCDKTRYHSEEEHHDPDKDLTWKKQ